MKGVLTVLKLAIKYGAYFTVLIKVIEFATKEVEEINSKEEKKSLK